jgi:hypothetical protein
LGKKSKRLGRNDAVARLDAMIELIYRDIGIAIEVEAALEAGNTIVCKEFPNTHYDGAHCYNAIRQSCALFLALTLAKLFEIPKPRGRESRSSCYNRSDVASIPLMIRLLKQERCRHALAARAREWTAHLRDTGDAQQAACERAIDAAVKAYSDLRRTYDGRSAITKLSDFRNKALAHILLGEALKKRPSYNDLFLLMDAARDVTDNAKRAILGNNLDLKNVEKECARTSKVFWSLALKALSTARPD